MSRMSFMARLLDGINVEWEPLGRISELVRGNGLQKKDFTETGVPAIHYGQIYTYYGLSTTKTKSFVSPDLAKQLRKVDKGDVVITNTSENLEDVGKALVYLGDRQAVTGGHATIVKPGQCLLGKYFAYFTQTDEFAGEKRKYAKGTKVIDVSATDMAKIKIPIPSPDNPKKSLEIQAEIVRILDAFTELTAELTAKLTAELTARKKQYNHYRNQLLHLDATKVEWTTLGDENSFEIANTTRRPVKASLRAPGKNPYYGANNVQGYVDGHTHDGDYVLIAEDGSASLEDYSIQYASGKFWANNHVHVVRGTQRFNTKFLYHYLRTVDFIPFLPNKERAKLTKGEMVKIPVPIPCPEDQEESLKAQGKIVRILDKFDALTKSISEALPCEIALRRQQYAYYRELLLSFPKPEEVAG